MNKFNRNKNNRMKKLEVTFYAKTEKVNFWSLKTICDSVKCAN